MGYLEITKPTGMDINQESINVTRAHGLFKKKENTENQLNMYFDAVIHLYFFVFTYFIENYFENQKPFLHFFLFDHFIKYMQMYCLTKLCFSICNIFKKKQLIVQ